MQYRVEWLKERGYVGLPEACIEWWEEQRRLRVEEEQRWTPYFFRKLFDLVVPPDAIRGVLNRDEIMERTDMMRIVELYILPPYRVMGSRMTVRCPFHADKTPSMTVYLPQKRWWCYVCNEGGTAIDLIMKAEGLGFKEALRKLDSIV